MLEEIVRFFSAGILSIGLKEIAMYLIGAALIWLAIEKDYEPMLLLPIGFGAILINLPLGTVWEMYGEPGILQTLFNAGILSEVFPLLIFIGVGAMIDFSPLFQRPWLMLFGAAAHIGIFVTVIIAMAFGYDLKEAACIGVIGAADGPTTIIVTKQFAKDLLGPIMVVAYSYMSLVPIIQPPVIRALTTKKERLIRMQAVDHQIPRSVTISFPIIVTIVSCLLVPMGAPLIGFLMFGNLLRVCGVLEKLSSTAQNELANIVTLLLGISVAASMRADAFLRLETLGIMALGLIAFIINTAGGVLFAKLINLFLPKTKKINPMIGACGISAFPMSSRVIQKMALKDDPHNIILMHAVSANVSGQLGSVIAGGLLLALVPLLAGGM
ncbi:sodium ion-translocating decarboxylase subunit beta [Treponema zuelzerae]|uniref:Sodium ion-translocating decarboxylase subunit beta n=1 Tax=Teretinema zuelzerae TaxID=156 RepID=A0AAE3EKA8_9SPIR|nr:sodium ion-translocating decarboxylase subunit beta [Teretinema zuelzerae]MBN2810843.1 sodium ion-translocating decarboxylase subunit beta [Spirochaetales bacterium]MCD1655431.1 sodium ion-translocating decarboxylase subunit beta [Teretinema zuelzerae]